MVPVWVCGKAGDAVGQTLYTFALLPQTNTYIARKMEGIGAPALGFLLLTLV